MPSAPRNAARPVLILALVGLMAGLLTPTSGAAAAAETAPAAGASQRLTLGVAPAVSHDDPGRGSSAGSAAHALEGPTQEIQPPSPRRLPPPDGASARPADDGSGVMALERVDRGALSGPSFPMIDLAKQIDDQGQFRTPPDTTIAVGPDVVVEMVNSTMSIWRKSDGALLTDPVIDLDTIFPVPSGHSYGDPRVLYDSATKRWYASIHTVGHTAAKSEVQLAVSETSDPLGAWKVYAVAIQQDDVLYDQPRLGFTDDKIMLAWDNFAFSTGDFTGAQYTVVEKAQALAAANALAQATSVEDITAFAIVPAANRSVGNEGFMVWNDGNPAFLAPGTAPRLVLIRVTGTPAGAVMTFTERFIPMRTSVPPPNADDATSDPVGGESDDEDKIDGGDERLLQAEWQNGLLWTAASNGCVPPGDSNVRVCSRLLQVDTAAETMRQDFDVSQAGGDVFFPSVTFNGLGDAMFAFSAVTPSTFVAAVAATQLTSDRNLIRGLTTVKPGEVPYVAWACFGRPGPSFGHRWGDYSGAAPDPSSPMHAWVAAEYAARAPAGSPTDTSAGDCNWATAGARLTFPAPTITSAPMLRGGETVTLTGTDFSLDSTVRVDGQVVGGASVVDSTTIRFTAPPHAPGVATITVTTPYGTSAPFAARYPDGYWLAASDGGIFGFGDVGFFGSTGDIALNKPIVTIAPTRAGNGYWLAASDGGIFSFGDASFFGSTGNIALNSPIVTMARTPSGQGYWLAAADGGIFAFGDAGFFGSTGDIKLNKPIVGMTPTASGAGYWLTASDGGIFAFGDAQFLGSTGDIVLNKPIVAMAATRSGNGYWLAANDGGIFAFGDAPFLGSTGGIALNHPIVAMTRTADGTGYWLTASDGGIFNFGGAPFLGSTGDITLNRPIVAMASLPATAVR